jgi:hypothetical protein
VASGDVFPPLDARQLGEFLYQAARVSEQQDVEQQTPSGPMRVAMVSRPYLSGVELYELEVRAACSRHARDRFGESPAYRADTAVVRRIPP